MAEIYNQSNAYVEIDNNPTESTFLVDNENPTAVVYVSIAQRGIDGVTTVTGGVISVNGEVGVVVLDADDIDDTTTTNKFVTAEDLINLSNLDTAAYTDSGIYATSGQGALAETAIQPEDLGTAAYSASGDFGDVYGPASSTSGNFPIFADSTGKLLADSGLAIQAVTGLPGSPNINTIYLVYSTP